MGLKEYRRKRGFGGSPEAGSGPRFVIQHHAERSDHYDLRLEIGGVLVSWAIPRGPSTSPRDRRMARRTEDHPLECSTSEGVMPDGEYGAGQVIVWDHGTYANRTEYEMARCLGRGHLSFRLNGKKLHGGYALTRIREGEDETWLLLKRSDDEADARRSQVLSRPESTPSGQAPDELS